MTALAIEDNPIIHHLLDRVQRLLQSLKHHNVETYLLLEEIAQLGHALFYRKASKSMGVTSPMDRMMLMLGIRGLLLRDQRSRI